MIILITGIGISGKSTLRRNLVQAHRAQGLTTHHIDVDKNFPELRHPADSDLLDEFPATLSPDEIYLIEDVHGPTNECLLPLDYYDLIIYVLPSALTYLKNLSTRFYIWWKKGHYKWEPQTGWQGTGKKFDPINLPPLLIEFFKMITSRNSLIQSDLQNIKKYPHKIIYT